MCVLAHSTIPPSIHPFTLSELGVVGALFSLSPSHSHPHPKPDHKPIHAADSSPIQYPPVSECIDIKLYKSRPLLKSTLEP